MTTAYNNFDSWTPTSATINTGVTDPDGGSLAFEHVHGAASGISNIIEPGTADAPLGATIRVSIKGKGNTADWYYVAMASISGKTINAYFDFTNGAVGTTGADVTDSGITDLGGGWYEGWWEFLNDSGDAVGQMRMFLPEGDNDLSWASASGESVYIYSLTVRDMSSDVYLVDYVVGADVANGANQTLTFQTTLQQNDLVIVYGGHGVGETTLTSPGSGYTEISKNTGVTPIFGAWYKLMGSVPDTSVLCNGGGNANDGCAYNAFVFRGADTSSPMDVTATTAGPTSGTNPNCPSITPVTSGSVVLALAGVGVFDTSIDGPSSYWNFVSSTANDVNGISVAGAFAWWDGVGTEDPPAFSLWSTVDDYYAITAAIRPLQAVASGLSFVDDLTKDLVRDLVSDLVK